MKICCVCESEENLTSIGLMGAEVFVCENCHFLATNKIMIKCSVCGSVSVLPRSWEIFERLMERVGTPKKEYVKAMEHFFQQAVIVFYPACPNCKGVNRRLQ